MSQPQEARWTRFVNENALVVEEQLSLTRLGLRDGIENGDPVAELQALREVVRLRPAYRPKPGEGLLPSRESASKGVELGSKAEKAHARAISERISLFAESDPKVQQLRRSLFGTPKPLPAKQARELLESPLLRFAMRHDLDQAGIPLIGHKSAIISSVESGSDALVEIRVDWSSGDKVLRFGWPLPSTYNKFIEFSESGRRRAVGPVRFASVLDDLGRGADGLAMRPPYSALRMSGVGVEPACVWLILTGKAARLEAISAGREIPGSVDSITITALTRVVSPNSVLRAFSEMQRRTLGHRKGRAFVPRNLDLVLFVERQEHGPVSDMPGPMAEDLCRRWNLRYASRDSWQFSDGRELARAYDRAKKSFFPDDEETYALTALAVIQAEIRRRSEV